MHKSYIIKKRWNPEGPHPNIVEKLIYLLPAWVLSDLLVANTFLVVLNLLVIIVNH